MYMYNSMVDIATNGYPQPNGDNYFLGERITRVRIRSIHSELASCVSEYNNTHKKQIILPELNTRIINKYTNSLIRII